MVKSLIKVARCVENFAENVKSLKRGRMRGEFKSTLDSKGRMNIPSKLREEFGDGMILARTLDAKCLTMMSGPEAWDNYMERNTKGLSEIKSYRLERFWAATDVESDGQGRILIPRLFREYAELNGELVVVMYKNRAEIWSKEIYESENTGDNMEELVRMVESD